MSDLWYIPGAQPHEHLRAHQGFTLNGVQYPGNFPKADVPGAQAVVYDEMPNGFIYDIVENIEGARVTYTATPKPLAEVQARMIATVKATAGTLLQGSDWKVIRAAEGGAPVDEVTAAYRATIRLNSNEHEAAILACTTVEELAALVLGWPTVEVVAEALAIAAEESAAAAADTDTAPVEEVPAP